MFTPLSKVLVVAAMLIAFVGQAFAYTAMPCEMSGGAHHAEMGMDHSSMNSHDGMAHGDMKVSTSTSEECCDVECICPVNACTSVTFLNSNHGLSHVLGFTEALASQRSEQPKSIPTSLYRPPIFA